jgi:hypothetical protein
MAVKVRTLTEEEAQELTRWAHARTAPHRLVQRAQMIWARCPRAESPGHCSACGALGVAGPGLDPAV